MYDITDELIRDAHIKRAQADGASMVLYKHLENRAYRLLVNKIGRLRKNSILEVVFSNCTQKIVYRGLETREDTDVDPIRYKVMIQGLVLTKKGKIRKDAFEYDIVRADYHNIKNTGLIYEEASL